MSSLSRSTFVETLRHSRVRPRDLEGVTANEKAELSKADTNGDGVIKGAAELNKLFTRMDHFDTDGHSRSVDTAKAPIARMTQAISGAAGKPRTALRGSGGTSRAGSGGGASGSSGTERPSGTSQTDSTEKADKAVATRAGGSGTSTVAGCAQALLNNPNVKFWDHLSSGSDRKNIERLAQGLPARVPATGRQVMPKLRMMQALVKMAERGPIQIQALTGGQHSRNSSHYRGAAVDLSIHVGNTADITRTARTYGGRRNSEKDHIHLDF